MIDKEEHEIRLKNYRVRKETGEKVKQSEQTEDKEKEKKKKIWDTNKDEYTNTELK